MPWLRYFLFVGGILLALLFAADAILPQLPASGIASDANLPVIRIHSERKGPEAVALDTSIVPAETARVETATAAETPATQPESHVRESFAQFPPPRPKGIVVGEPKKGRPKQPPNGKFAGTRVNQPPVSEIIE